LIGMAGIIINDSIVLVSTVDQYAKERGLIPSIADAAADRLRPVLLTTATTVLGLGPLLFERSNDAQFLRPTVITLAYGLGFGMVLVLLIVPSLLAMGHDISRMIRSLRRALRMPAVVGPGVRMMPMLAAVLVLAAFATTMGWALITGQSGPLTEWVWPGSNGALLPALAAFLGATAVSVVLVWGLGAVALALTRRARPSGGVTAPTG
jgi:hypothetical protein